MDPSHQKANITRPERIGCQLLEIEDIIVSNKRPKTYIAMQIKDPKIKPRNFVWNWRSCEAVISEG